MLRKERKETIHPVTRCWAYFNDGTCRCFSGSLNEILHAIDKFCEDNGVVTTDGRWETVERDREHHRDAEKGTYDGQTTYCPVNGWDCPYYKDAGVCHIEDPVADCDDFAMCFESWEDWLNA